MELELETILAIIDDEIIGWQRESQYPFQAFVALDSLKERLIAFRAAEQPAPQPSASEFDPNANYVRKETSLGRWNWVRRDVPDETT